MAKDKHITKVIFRKFKDGDIIAFFPEHAGNRDPSTCESYMHVGQHGSASEHLTHDTKLATPEEYKDLYRELEGIGYNIQVVKKFTRLHYRKRLSEVAR